MTTEDTRERAFSIQFTRNISRININESNENESTSYSWRKSKDMVRFYLKNDIIDSKFKA